MRQWFRLPFLAALLAATAVQPVIAADDQKKISRELAELDRRDQEDQSRWEQIGDAEASRRQRERRARVLEIVSQGQLGTPLDYHHASWLLQHGDGIDDFLMAHILATTASFEGLSQSFFLSAAALDRFMMFAGQEQRFGSQSTDAAGADRGDVSRLLNDSIVQRFSGGSTGLRGKPVRPEDRSAKKLKSARRFLAKEGKKAEKTAARGGDEWAAILARTREIVALGQLDEAGDFYSAGRILVHASDKETVLLAHIMATAAGILEHKKARPLYMETMDRYMLSLGRSPIFSDEIPDEMELEKRPAILELHRKIRARITRGGKR